MPGQVRASPRKPIPAVEQEAGTHGPANRPQTPARCPAVALATCTSSEDSTVRRRARAVSEQTFRVLAER